MFGCSSNECYYSQNKPLQNITVENITEEISTIKKVNDFGDFLSENKKTLYPFYEIEDTSFLLDKAANAFSLIDNLYFDSLSYDVSLEFDNLQRVFYQFDKSIEKLNKESNRIFNPKITVLTSGFFNDVVVNGENIVIGLDYFLSLIHI